MKYVYVLVYTYDNKSISDYIFFNSCEEAIEWKKQKIASKECGNPIEAYTTRRLDANGLN